MPALRVIYTRRHTLGSVLIRAAAYGGPWSHCGVIDGDSVIESLASHCGVVRSSLDDAHLRSSASVIADVECPDPEAGLQWARSTLGLPYDWSGIFGIPFRRRDWQRPGRWYCSEHVEMSLMYAGRPRFRPGMPGISPTQSYYAR
jgi:uncharacterized protein YycO